MQSKAGLCEGVHYGFEYHMLNKEGKGITPPIQCKDFLTDLYWSEYLGKPIEIYGFKWEPKKLKKAEWYRIAVKYNNQSMKSHRKALESFLNQWEERLDFEESTVTVDDTETALVVEFSKEWTEKPILVSAFTLFLRMGCQYDPDVDLEKFMEEFPKRERVWAACDKGYIASEFGKKHVDQMLKGKSDFAQSYADFESNYAIHGQSGIMCWRG